jgi:hypothetical protein
MGWNPFKKSSWQKVGDTVTKTTSTVTKQVEKTATDVGNTVAQGTETAVSTVSKAATDAYNTTAKATQDAIATINNTVVSPATESTIQSWNTAAQGAAIGCSEFTAGCTTAGAALEAGGKAVGDDLVAMGEYVAANICTITLSAAISGAFAATLNNPGTEEETTAMFAPLCAETASMAAAGAVDAAVIATECQAVCAYFVEVLWAIPDVRKGVGGNKDVLISSLAALLGMAISEAPWAYVSPQTASLVVAGLVGYTTASLCCTGHLPG